MARALPPLNPLRTFEVLARTGSISAAADELSVTHGAVSHQIRSLESSLNLHLFHRDQRSLRLTQAGALYAQQVRQAFNMLAESTQKLNLPSGQGRLYISCAPALASGWLVRHLRDFRRQFPDIDIDLKAHNHNADSLKTAHYDVAIIWGTGDFDDRATRLLTEMKMFPVCSPLFFPLGELPRQVQDIQGRWLLHEDEGGNWKRWLASVGAHVDDFAHGTHLWGAHLAVGAAASGLGIAIGDDIVCADYFRQGRLVRMFDTTVPAIGAYYSVCERGREQEPRIALFIDWLEQRMKWGQEDD